MPLFIEGWIETTGAVGVATAEEHAWLSVVNLGSVVLDDADFISERLFGLSKASVTARSIGLFGGRGAPPNPSQEVRAALSSIAVHEGSVGRGEYGGFTWALWSEIASVTFEPASFTQSRWSVAFALSRTLLHPLLSKITRLDGGAPHEKRLQWPCKAAFGMSPPPHAGTGCPRPGR